MERVSEIVRLFEQAHLIGCIREFSMQISPSFAMEETHVERGTVVTLREEGNIAGAYGEIEIIPAWKWALC